jgi:predicted dehydrogenase
METVRIGIIGYGNMGSSHAQYFGQLTGATLAAICDVNPERCKSAAERYKVPVFASHHELLASGTCDAIIIAVPHYDHVPIAMDAFERGVHVMAEKPLAVSVTAAHQVAEAYKRYPKLKFGIMFQLRTHGLYRKVRQLVADGELGEITRVTWIITNWFRTWTYYGSGGWRATWKGEGGGVLINQCPHNLDLIQWVLNGLMPSRITAVGFVGKTHPIEVEDEVSAILEYPNGAIGHFITSTGEAPGTNRLEICGDRGKLVAEQGKLKFYRTRQGVREVNEKSPESFASIETWEIDIPFTTNRTPEHQIVTQRFVDVIRENRPNSDLIAQGPEGARGLEIGNAMLMSGLQRRAVELPVNGAEYDAFIEQMHKTYGGRKTLQTRKPASADMAASFSH